MTNNALDIVANVLESVCSDILDESLDRSHITGRVSIRDQDLCVDVKALTWALSNMCRGGFRTADYWDMVTVTKDGRKGMLTYIASLS
jgi:hypothetical protein